MLLVALFNGYLLYFVCQQNKKTFLDWMIVFDSILCVANCVTLAGGAKFRGSFKKNYLGVQKYVLFLSIFRQCTSTVLKILNFHTHTPHHSIFSIFLKPSFSNRTFFKNHTVCQMFRHYFTKRCLS